MTENTGQDEGGQVSEIGGMSGDADPISPQDATAADPGDESGDTQEGTAGPNAAPRHDPPEDDNESSK